MTRIGKNQFLESYIQKKGYNINTWLGKFVATGEGGIPYSMNGKSEVVSNSIFENQNLRKEPKVHREERRPSYVILMPHVRPNDNDPTEILGKLTMIRDNAFDDHHIGFPDETSKRISVVLGVNEFYSLDPVERKKFQRYVRSMQDVEGIAFRAIGFMWSPRWSTTFNRSLVYTLDKAFFLLKVVFPELAQEVAIKAKAEAAKMIPYQEIRQTIKDSEAAYSLCDLVQRRLPHSPRYVTTMDSDFYGLKKNGLGVFSQLDHLVQKTMREKGFPPDVISPGYRAPDHVPGMTRLQVDLDMLTREAMNKYVPGAPYYPEPLVSVRLAFGRSIRELSYKAAGETLESRRLIQNGVHSGLIDRAKMVFSASGILKTDVDRMITMKAKSIGAVTARNIHQKQVWNSLHGISQSHANPNQWAENLYAAIPLKYSNSKQAYVPLRKLYQVFDPVKLVELIQSEVKEKYRKEHFEKALQIHKKLAAAIMDDSEEIFPVLAQEIYPGRDIRQRHCKELFQSQLNECRAAKEKLKEFGLQAVWIDRCVHAAKVAGDAARKLILDIANGNRAYL